jgi:hypothetical protein
MNNFMYEMERKFGKYAINNLTIYIIGLYAVGYILQIIPGGGKLISYLTLNPYLILHGQIWRLISWVIIPPQAISIWLLITLYLYYFIGTTMERTMGTFRYNVFIFGGIICMILSAFVSYAYIALRSGGDTQLIAYNCLYYSGVFSTYYLQQAVFLSFALSYPDLQLLLMFIIPVKVKYLGIFYAALLGFEAIYSGLIQGALPLFFVILFQFINLALFYLSTGKLSHMKPKEVQRRREFHRNVQMTPKGVTRHKCAVCGRSEVDNPNLEFRFCSKCNGNYEYCQDHLFTHTHVK